MSDLNVTQPSPAPEETPTDLAVEDRAPKMKRNTIIALSLAAVLVVGGGTGVWAYSSGQAKQLAQAVEQVQDLHAANVEVAKNLEQTIDAADLTFETVGQDVVDEQALTDLEQARQAGSALVPLKDAVTGDKKVTAQSLTVQENLTKTLIRAEANLAAAITGVELSHADFVWNAQAKDLNTEVADQLDKNLKLVEKSSDKLGDAKILKALKDSTTRAKELAEVDTAALEVDQREGFTADVAAWKKDNSSAVENVNKELTKIKEAEEKKAQEKKATEAARAKAAQAQPRATSKAPAATGKSATRTPAATSNKSTAKAPAKSTPAPAKPKPAPAKPKPASPAPSGGGWVKEEVPAGPVCLELDTKGNSKYVPCK